MTSRDEFFADIRASIEKRRREILGDLADAAPPSNRINPRRPDLYEYAVVLGTKMFREHGLRGRMELGNSNTGFHQQFHTGLHRIRLGRKCIDRYAARGFLEYKSYKWLWTTHGEMMGKKAVWAMVLHEMGHAIQVEAGKRTRGNAHNGFWANAVCDLQTLYPYEECEEIKLAD